MSAEPKLSSREKFIEIMSKRIIKTILNFDPECDNMIQILRNVQNLIHTAQRENKSNNRHLSFSAIYDNFLKCLSLENPMKNELTDKLYYDLGISNDMYHRRFND